MLDPIDNIFFLFGPSRASPDNWGTNMSIYIKIIIKKFHQKKERKRIVLVQGQRYIKG
jgi:hypothetical protein